MEFRFRGRLTRKQELAQLLSSRGSGPPDAYRTLLRTFLGNELAEELVREPERLDDLVEGAPVDDIEAFVSGQLGAWHPLVAELLTLWNLPLTSL